MNGWLGWVVLFVGIVVAFVLPRRIRSSRGKFPPSPYGCTHGYYIPCSECSLRVRERYNRKPEWYPVYVRGADGRVVGIDSYRPALAPTPEKKAGAA